MLHHLQILVLVVCVTNVAGHPCIHATNKNKCQKGTNECYSESPTMVCMDIESGKSGKYKSLCGLPQSEGCLCDKNLVSSEACEAGLTCQEEKGKHKCLPSEPVGPVCSSAERNWELIYHNDQHGSALNGSNIDNLVIAVKQGAEIKVWTLLFGLTNVQKASIADDEDLKFKRVQGQALFWVKPSGTGAHNLFFVFSTNGNVHVTQFFIGNSENSVRQNRNFPSEMKWFVRKMSAKVDNHTQLFTSVKDGANVRVLSDDAIRHLEVADIDSNRVQGLSIWEMRDRLGGLEFNTTEQWLQKHWSDDGNVQKASWLVNDHTMTESEHLQGIDIDWFVDVCWSLVYRHNDHGDALFGSKSKLLESIEEGKRVKVRIGTQFFEANSLRETNGDDVVMQVYDSVDFDVNQGKWRWLNVSTSGVVTTYVVAMGNGTDVISSSNNTMVSWFIENRDWQTVAPAYVADKMNKAIDSGSDVRFSVRIGTVRVWYQADVISQKLGAYNEREVVYEGNQYVRRYSYASWKSNPSTYSYMDFLVGTTQQVDYQSPSAASITWYISQ